MKANTLCFALLLGLSLAACKKGDTFSVKTPDNFVSLSRWKSRTTYKAVSPDNTVIAVRSIKHRDKGTLGYWSTILERQLTLKKGYKLAGKKAVKTAAGLSGSQLTFHTKSGSQAYTYLVTVFVTPDWIYVVEAGMQNKLVARYQADVDALIVSFKPR